MSVKFSVDVLLGTGLGVVVGAFLPLVGRKIKALFVKETTKVKTAVVAEVVKAEADVKAKL